MNSNKRPNQGNRPERKEKEYEQKMADLARVTRVMAGGKRMSFRSCVVIGDRKGRVAYGVAKGPDVQISISKAVKIAEKNWLTVNMTEDGTITHELNEKFKSAKIMLKPAPVGTGIKAGGAVRIVLDLAGIKNIVGKQLGSGNKINNVKATYNALGRLRVARKKKVSKPKEKTSNQ